MDMLSLQWLLSRAELTGSRGYARHYGLPEPLESDYDWSIFTDNLGLMAEALTKAEKVKNSAPDQFKLIFRGPVTQDWSAYGFTLHSKELKLDINVKPLVFKWLLRHAWALVEAGQPKLEAWRVAHARFNLICED